MLIAQSTLTVSQVPILVAQSKRKPLFLVAHSPVEVPSPRATFRSTEPGEASIIQAVFMSRMSGEFAKEVWCRT